MIPAPVFSGAALPAWLSAILWAAATSACGGSEPTAERREPAPAEPGAPSGPSTSGEPRGAPPDADPDAPDRDGLLEALGAIPFGYGQHTTGGCYTDACKCKVTNLDDSGPGSLRSCVSSDDPKWVVFEGAGRGTIHLESSLKIGSNTTIDGRGEGPVTVTASQTHIAFIRDSQNVIVTDMKFQVELSAICDSPPDPETTFGCGGGIEIDGTAKNVWIHQSQFSTCGGKCIAVWTHDAEAPDPKDCDAKAHGGDLITISSNVFESSFYGVLIGASHLLPNCQIPPMRVSVYRNVFDDVDRRSPRSSELSHVHVLNNVAKNWGPNSCDDSHDEAFAASAMSGGQMLLENNFFQARPSSGACKVATHIDGGFVRAIGNIATNGAIVHSHLPAQVFDPQAAAKEFYAYDAAPMTTKLRKQVEAEAGPRL